MGIWFEPRCHPVNAVILQFACGHFRYTQLAKEWQQVDAPPDLMTIGPFLAALSLGNDFVFSQKLRRRLCEASFGEQDADLVLAAKFEIPVFGKFGRQ